MRKSLANPAGRITDMEALSALAKKIGVPLIIDNTVASPYLCRPIEHGADIVVHSMTKFLCGHGNSMCGIVVEREQLIGKNLANILLSAHRAQNIMA